MSDLTKQDPPKIEFPCADYPIKVIGRDVQGFHDFVIEVMQKHAADFDASMISTKESSKGSFISVRVRITATGVSQLKAIHQDLIVSEHVKMVI